MQRCKIYYSCSYKVDHIFSEKLSGANADRPQLRAMLDYVREGDTLYIESISRLGRSTKDLLNIIDTLTEKGVTLVSHKENIDTDTPAGKFMLTVFAALSQLEREQLKQRQREGIEIAKVQGKYTGRKPIEIDWTRFGQLYGEWKSKSITERDFMRRMGLSANTFYRRVREYEAEHGIAEPVSARAYYTEDFYNIAAPCTIIITITPQGWTPVLSWDIMYLQ